jgi:RNA polymerase sigma-70 factor (ECF subfamily)
MNEAFATEPEEWVDEYGDYLFRYAMRMLRDAGHAEDVVQETFLAALDARKNFSGRSSVKTWLTGILKRKIVDHLRKAKRRRSSLDFNVEEEGKLDGVFDHEGHWAKGPAAWWVINPRKLFEKKEFWEVLRQCLSELPPRLASAFLLREIEGMTTREVCEALEVSESNVWVMLHRSRMHLRKCLETNWFLGRRRRS